jgi:hypothetical protein
MTIDRDEPTPRPLQLTNAVSPTGLPWLSPTAARWLAIVVIVVGPMLAGLLFIYPAARGLQAAAVVVASVATALGIASPGIRLGGK